MYAFCEMCLLVGIRKQVHESQFIKTNDSFRAFCPEHLQEIQASDSITTIEQMKKSMRLIESA